MWQNVSLTPIGGLSPHTYTPCEILHTVLLGIDKYLWHDSNKVWDKKKDDLFALQSHYLVQYTNSLIGKRCKNLQQLAIFHLHDDLCSNALFEMWRANGELGALLWFPEIKEMVLYLVCGLVTVFV